MELINREEVKTIIECTTGYHKAIKDAFDRVMELPIIESRPKGKWIDSGQVRKIGGYSAYCSVCGEWSEYLTNFCGNCGADMGGK